MGLIAQQVEQVVPQAIERDALGYLSVSYGNLAAALMVESIKELDTKYEEKVLALEAKIQEQQKIIDELLEFNRNSIDDGK